MFCKVMANPEVCRSVLEVILGRKIAEAKLVISTQESIQNAYAAKGVRLDVMADDESHTRHNAEADGAGKRERRSIGAEAGAGSKESEEGLSVQGGKSEKIF